MSKPGSPTTKPVAEAIESLRNALFRDYGVDYAFIVLAKGLVLGAANKFDGVIEAVTCEGETP